MARYWPKIGQMAKIRFVPKRYLPKGVGSAKRSKSPRDREWAIFCVQVHIQGDGQHPTTFIFLLNFLFFNQISGVILCYILIQVSKNEFGRVLPLSIGLVWTNCRCTPSIENCVIFQQLFSMLNFAKCCSSTTIPIVIPQMVIFPIFRVNLCIKNQCCGSIQVDACSFSANFILPVISSNF